MHLAKITPILIGGGHEIAWGHYQGLVQAYPESSIGVINFDSHFDLRLLLEGDLGSSGTPFTQIANLCQQQQRQFSYLCLGIQETVNTQNLFARAQQLQVSFVEAKNIEEAKQQLADFLTQHTAIYLTVCLDVFANYVAPGVSAPQALGLLPLQVLPLIQQVINSEKLISVDIAELSPPHDQRDQTAKLAASLVTQFII